MNVTKIFTNSYGYILFYSYKKFLFGLTNTLVFQIAGLRKFMYYACLYTKLIESFGEKCFHTFSVLYPCFFPNIFENFCDDSRKILPNLFYLGYCYVVYVFQSSSIFNNSY